ncbi:MAG: alpha/beta hydrolase-fold protein [Planctomycetota bacterium]
MAVAAWVGVAAQAVEMRTWRDDTPERLKRVRFEGLPWERDCWVYFPEGYDETKRYALVVVLHPAGLRGLRFAKIWGQVADKTGEFLVLAPEALDTQKRLWRMSDEPVVIKTLDKALDVFSAIDPNRVLLTGFSLGGNYAYLFGLRHPARFRAIAVVSGALKARPSPRADAILRRARNVPVYIVHGAQDPHVPVARARASRDRLEALGYQVTYRELPHGGHFYPQGESARIWAWFKALTGKKAGESERGD